jgi:hypothetical protein
MDSGDVANYRNMVQVIGDRIKALKGQGKSLAEVRATRPTLDYDGVYGSPDAFIEATFKSLEKR